MKLTAKQEKFVEGLISGLSQREAYKAAYDCKRMKNATVDQCASKLFKHPKITTRYEELKKASERVSENSAVEIRAMLIESHKKIINVNPLEYIEQKGAEGDYYLTSSLIEKDGFAIKELKTDKYGKVIGVVFYDKAPSMAALERIYGIAPEESAENNDVVFKIDIEGADL